MLHIVGGTYVEKCIEPSWFELYGPGGRAATALASLDNDITLSTYIGASERPSLEILANTFDFKLNATEILNTIVFDYYHCLSEPLIYPNISLIPKEAPIRVDAGNILRYGFIEGDAIVEGEKVVYDPQNAYCPELFGANGSKARHLAIVTNTSECRKLTENAFEWHETGALGKRLLEIEDADVVVVKRGSLGATIVTRTKKTDVPAFQTSKVWSIGSGDIFAAIFAHFWISGDKDPFEAAHLASVATASYCNSRVLPIRIDFVEHNKFRPLESKNKFPIEPKNVYLAGPFFTMAERWVIDQARKYLTEQGFTVFSPFHDVGLGEAEEVVPADIDALVKSDIVFAVLDGLDAGTLFEVGYARSIDKPVVAFVQNETSEDLKMIEGTDCEIVKDFVSAIYRTVWYAMQL